MIRGLAAANPEHAGRIETERSVEWTNNESWSGKKIDRHKEGPSSTTFT
jgi:hypothetical protein